MFKGIAKATNRDVRAFGLFVVVAVVIYYYESRSTLFALSADDFGRASSSTVEAECGDCENQQTEKKIVVNGVGRCVQKDLALKKWMVAADATRWEHRLARTFIRKTYLLATSDRLT